MKEENLKRAQEIKRDLDDLRGAMGFLELEATTTVNLWVNGKGSWAIQGTSLSPMTSGAIRALLRVETRAKIKALKAELETL